MNRIVFLFLFFSVITGCAFEQAVEGNKEVKKIDKTPLPAWVYELPPGDNLIIGVSGKSIYEDQMKDANKQMAAVMHSRNRSSYTISNRASTEKEEFLSGGSAGFNLNVSSSPQETRRIFNSLKMLDETVFYGYYLALYSDGKASIVEKHKKKIVLNSPEWYKKDELKLEGDLIISCASASSSDLVVAWENAAEKARFEIARYLEKDVMGAVINENERIEKKIAVETRKKLSHLRINRSFISSKLYDNLRSYQVYLELTTK